MQLIGQLRGVRGGGVSTGQQRMAYHNIVIQQIGELDATTLTRLVWRISPDRLGAEQYDTLIRWGKEDNFAEEVPLVLSVLRAERERETQSGPQGEPGTPTPTTTTTVTPATRSASAPRPTASAPRAASQRGSRQPARQDHTAPPAPDDQGDPEAY